MKTNSSLNRYQKLVLLFMVLLSSQPIFAQRNFSLYQLNTTAQSHYLNPAFKPNSKVYLSLPLGMQSFGASHSGFTVNHLIHSRSQDDSLELKPAIAIDKMAKLNFVNLDLQNEIFGFGFRTKKSYFSFGIVHRSQINFMYSRDLFRFAFEGNGQRFLGERASLDGLGFNLNSYLEYGIGFNHKFGEKLTIGGRLKMLSGIANVHTRKSELGIFTDETTFDLTIDGALEVNSSNMAPFFDSTTTNFNPAKYAFNFDNRGFGLDLGAMYEMTEKISFSASVVDLGFINWKTNNRNFASTDFNYTFQGVNLNDFLKDSSDVFENLNDTLKDVFRQTENTNAYRTSLYTRFYIGGSYKFTEKLILSGLWYNEILHGKYRPGLTVAANFKAKEWFSATVNYTAYGRSFSNLGAGFSLRGGPIQFFLMSDNLLGFLVPQGSKNIHLTTGLSLLFGKPDKKTRTSERVNG